MLSRTDPSRAAILVGVVMTLAAAAPTAAAADARCLRPDVAGGTTVDVNFGGKSYPVAVYVPDGAPRNARLPLLLNLHGSSTNGSIQMQVSGMRAVADDEGFIVAAPNGAIPVPPPPTGRTLTAAGRGTCPVFRWPSGSSRRQRPETTSGSSAE